jgi:hypothetical protein
MNGQKQEKYARFCDRAWFPAGFPVAREERCLKKGESGVNSPFLC